MRSKRCSKVRVTARNAVASAHLRSQLSTTLRRHQKVCPYPTGEAAVRTHVVGSTLDLVHMTGRNSVPNANPGLHSLFDCN